MNDCWWRKMGINSSAKNATEEKQTKSPENQERKKTIKVYLRQNLGPWGCCSHSMQTVPYNQAQTPENGFTFQYEQLDLSLELLENAYAYILFEGTVKFAGKLWDVAKFKSIAAKHQQLYDKLLSKFED
jgi:hypothetical protein